MENTAYGTPTGWNNTYAVDPVDWRKVLIEKVDTVISNQKTIVRTQSTILEKLDKLAKDVSYLESIV